MYSVRRFPVKNRRSVTAGISETPQDTIVRASTPTARPARSPRRHRSSSGRSGSRNGQVMASRGGLPASDGHPIATAASALPSSCRNGQPRRQRGKRPCRSSSGGMPSARRCGRQPSGAPSPPERRGWMSIVLVAGPAERSISAPLTVTHSRVLEALRSAFGVHGVLVRRPCRS